MLTRMNATYFDTFYSISLKDSGCNTLNNFIPQVDCNTQFKNSVLYFILKT